jgi:hypothetical protein
MRIPLKLAPWLLALGVSWGLGFIYNIFYGGELSFLRKMYYEKVAIAAEIKAPKRLILIGGSGVHHSFDSKLLEEKLGVPVINLGLDGPIGLNVLLPSVLPSVRQGDVVLFIPESTLLTSPDGILERSVSFGVGQGRAGLGNIPIKKFFEDAWLIGLPTYRGVIKSALDLVEKGKLTGYYSDPITDRGDPTIDKYRKGKWWGWKFSEPMTPHAVERISQFKTEVERKGGTLILALPWVYAPLIPQNLAYGQDVAQKLSAIAPTIYDPKTYNFQPEPTYLADTHYHFLPEGRKIHSEQVSRELLALPNSPFVSQTAFPSSSKP